MIKILYHIHGTSRVVGRLSISATAAPRQHVKGIPHDLALDKVCGGRSNVLVRPKAALYVAVQVGHVQRNGDEHQHHPLEVEAEQGDYEEDHPEHGTDDERCPKNLRLLRVDGTGQVGIDFARLVHPVGDALVIHVVPPAEADQYPARYVFHGPEVGR